MRVDGRREEGQMELVELVERLGRWCAREREELMLVGERKKGRFCRKTGEVRSAWWARPSRWKRDALEAE